MTTVNTVQHETETLGLNFTPERPDLFWIREGTSFQFMQKFLHANKIVNHWVHPYSPMPINFSNWSSFALLDLSTIETDLIRLQQKVSEIVRRESPVCPEGYEVEASTLLDGIMEQGVRHLLYGDIEGDEDCERIAEHCISHLSYLATRSPADAQSAESSADTLIEEW